MRSKSKGQESGERLLESNQDPRLVNNIFEVCGMVVDKKMEALKELGIPGPEVLRDSLTNCTDPLKAIEEFQSDNGILLPSLQPILPLLDLHGVRRLDFHTSVLEEMKEKLLTRIEELGRKDLPEKQRKENEERLKELMKKYFPVVRVPSLQPVVMAVLKNLDQVDDKYLKQLTSDKSLYEKCDVVVKRQIWQEHQGMFGDEVTPLLAKYIQEKESILLKHTDIKATFFIQTPRQRRQNETIQTLVKMIGKNVLLYDTILSFLRTLFLRTKNVHYCTLRVELLMALHEAEVSDITQMDPCHKFAWCLDACIREQTIDPKRGRELQSFLDGIRKGQEQIIGDLSMTLADHFAVNFLATSAMKILNSLVNSEGLARENTQLQLIIRLLNLGLHSWEILNSKVYREPKLDHSILTQFIPILMSLMVDDQVRLVNHKLPSDDRQSAIAIIEHTGPPPDMYQEFIAENRLAAVLAIYYTFQVCSKKDKIGLMRVVGCLGNSHENRAFDNPFLHNLVGYFIPFADEFENEEFATTIFDEFFLSGLPHQNTSHHVMKLVLHVAHKLSPSRTAEVLKSLSSCASIDQNEVSKELHQVLLEKVQQVQQELQEKEDESVTETDSTIK